jgi:hypothetical protein
MGRRHRVFAKVARTTVRVALLPGTVVAGGLMLAAWSPVLVLLYWQMLRNLAEDKRARGVPDEEPPRRRKHGTSPTRRS